jgi:hypothetical protein
MNTRYRSVMTKMPAPPAPFVSGATVRFLPDPNHVERVIECEWVPLAAQQEKLRGITNADVPPVVIATDRVIGTGPRYRS